MTFEAWAAFAAASTVLLVIPGPTVLLVVSYALGQGWRTALPMAVGVALGDFTAMTTEAGRAEGGATGRLVGQGVGYMAFAAGNPALFQLMFSREANGLESAALAAASEKVRALHAAAVEAVIPHASGEIKQRMADFAGASVHGFISLLLDGQIGGKDSSRALKARGLSLLSAMAETVVRVGG